MGPHPLQACLLRLEQLRRIPQGVSLGGHRDAGYSGETNEEVVDAWFKTIARQVLEDGGEDPDRNAGYIDTKRIDEDKTKIS